MSCFALPWPWLTMLLHRPHNRCVPSRPSIRLPKITEPAPENRSTNIVHFPTPAKMKNPAAVALGKLGGSKGGKIRAQRLSGERKKEIAQLAAKARWAKEKA